MMTEQLYAHGVESKNLYGHQQLVEESKVVAATAERICQEHQVPPFPPGV